MFCTLCIQTKRTFMSVKAWPLTPISQTLVVTEDSEASLRAILKYSLFQSESELQEQLDSIQGKKGTKILIWNIRRSVAQCTLLTTLCQSRSGRWRWRQWANAKQKNHYVKFRDSFACDLNVAHRGMHGLCRNNTLLICVRFEYNPELLSLTNQVILNTQKACNSLD